jgi:hypothetical protein
MVDFDQILIALFAATFSQSKVEFEAPAKTLPLPG